MKKYSELDSIGRKARKAEGRINCGICPVNTSTGHGCTGAVYEACDFIYLTAFRRGYDTRRKEDRLKARKQAYAQLNNLLLHKRKG